jgi:hypothetical protein
MWAFVSLIGCNTDGRNGDLDWSVLTAIRSCWVKMTSRCIVAQCATDGMNSNRTTASHPYGLRHCRGMPRTLFEDQASQLL